MSTALIPVAVCADDPAAPAAPASRPRADFVAQLIATKMEAPQTRARRRAAPAEAVAAYCMIGRSLPPSGGALSRSL